MPGNRRTLADSITAAAAASGVARHNGHKAARREARRDVANNMDAGQDRESVRTVGRRARSAWTAYMLDKHARRNSESGCGIYYETRAYVDIAKHAETPRYMAPPHTLDGQGARQDSMSSVSLREIGMAILQSMLN